MERPATTHAEPSAVTAPSAPAAPAEPVRLEHARHDAVVPGPAPAPQKPTDAAHLSAPIPPEGAPMPPEAPVAADPIAADSVPAGPVPEEPVTDEAVSREAVTDEHVSHEAVSPASVPDEPTSDGPGASAAETEDEGHHVFELPRIRALLVHALPRFVEGVIAPVVVFYAALTLLGLNGALVAAVAWVYGGIVYRYVRGHPVSGLLLLAAIGVTVRAGLSAATGSAVVYFLQPTLGTLLVSMSFLASVPLGKPLAMKLARDMAPIPDAFFKHGRVHRFFLRISLLWSMVLFTNVAVSLWMLFNQSISTYLWLRTSIVTALGAVGIGISVWAFRRLLRHINWRPAGSA